MCRKSHELFSDERLLAQEKSYMHENCYKRICEDYKIKKAEERFRSTRSLSQVSNVQRVSTRQKTSCHSESTAKKARNSHVLPVQCIICEKDTDQFVMVNIFQIYSIFYVDELFTLFMSPRKTETCMRK